MSKEDRLQNVLHYLDNHDSATIKELSGALYTSLSTTYRDLKELRRRNLINHADGYISRSREQAVPTPLQHRITTHVEEKMRIAEATVKLLHNDMTVYLDASATVSFLVEKLRQLSGITVLTNGLATVLMLRQAGVATICVGGALTENSLATCGRIANDTIDSYPIDCAFFSAYAVSSDGRITDPSEYEASFMRRIIHKAATTALLCDHSKFGKTSLFHTASLDQIDYLVTDILPNGIEANVRKGIILAK